METNRYAIVDTTTGLVLNVIVWDGVSPWSPPAGTEVHQFDTASPGDLFANDLT